MVLVHKQVITNFELNGIDTSNIVETSGVRPRRAAAAAFLEMQQAVEKQQEKEDSDDEEPLVTAPFVFKPAATPVGQYNLADSDSD